jgi:hypothetical protein
MIEQHALINMDNRYIDASLESVPKLQTLIIHAQKYYMEYYLILFNMFNWIKAYCNKQNNLIHGFVIGSDTIEEKSCL